MVDWRTSADAPVTILTFDFTMSTTIFREPDLSARPHRLAVERHMQLPAATVYKAWTTEFDRWFAAPGSVLMTGRVDTPFFFETEFSLSPDQPLQRHPHYGRFLALVPDRRIQLTWLTGAIGTKGAETVVTVELIAGTAGAEVYGLKNSARPWKPPDSARVL